MDKRLILAVAGAGKTTFLVNKLDIERRFVIVTYTNNNVVNLRKSIIKKFGYFPSNIKLLTYFQFLVNVCYKPFFANIVKAKGINWEMPPEETLKYKRTNPAFYLTKNRYLYHNRIAKICQGEFTEIKKRIEKYYDCFYFDEVQDLAGHDFNLVLQIVPSNIETIFVGDFYQHTFDTSRDGKVNGSLYMEFNNYVCRWERIGFIIDTNTLQKSHRCSRTICNFVRDKLGIDIFSEDNTGSDICYIQSQEEADNIILNASIPKLFYRDRIKFRCNGLNWGESKGLDDFVNVCIVLNKITKDLYEKNRLKDMAPSTKNKFYVACTRAKRNLYFVPIGLLGKYKS